MRDGLAVCVGIKFHRNLALVHLAQPFPYKPFGGVVRALIADGESLGHRQRAHLHYMVRACTHDYVQSSCGSSMTGVSETYFGAHPRRISRRISRAYLAYISANISPPRSAVRQSRRCTRSLAVSISAPQPALPRRFPTCNRRTCTIVFSCETRIFVVAATNNFS